MTPPRLWTWAALLGAAGGCALASGCGIAGTGEPQQEVRVTAARDDDAGALRFAIDGREAFVYQYGSEWAIPHIWPLRSPSGRSLLVQKTEPFPHHRSLWIVDKIQLGDGPVIDFYHEWQNRVDAERPELGHHSFIRHDGFTELRDGPGCAAATAELTWMIHGEPAMDQELRMELADLGDGEYSLHLQWSLVAAYGELRFPSDWVHYAWPYLRMDPAFNGENGGVITDDQGRRGQEATNGQYARWVDYSGTVDGVTEGVTVVLPDDGQPRKWLTREYGTFGPRRPDAWSGTKFRLERGERLSGEVRLLIHRGDVVDGRVAARVGQL